MVQFFVFFVFFVFTNLVLPAERRGFLKNKPKKTTKKTQFLKLKRGPIMLRNIIGPLFNFNLAHFLTLELCYFFLFFFGWNPYFIVFSAKMQNWKKHKKETKTLFVNTTVLTAFVKMSVFCAFFIFAVFPISIFVQRCFLTGFQKSKNNKIAKQE